MAIDGGGGGVNATFDATLMPLLVPHTKPKPQTLAGGLKPQRTEFQFSGS